MNKHGGSWFSMIHKVTSKLVMVSSYAIKLKTVLLLEVKIITITKRIIAKTNEIIKIISID